jgi:hypothetical protein
MGASLGENAPLIDSIDKALDYIENPGVLYYLNYMNALLITIINTMFFMMLYMYFNTKNPISSKLGIVFIPVYAAYNLFAYVSQISIVQQIQNISEYSQDSEYIQVILTQLTQAWSQSSIAFINNYAYAILGIPSLLFGILFLKKSLIGKITGWFLIINAIACVFGIVGIVMNNKFLTLGSAIGGVAFLSDIFISLFL